jgi:voltage-gated potassium channel
MRDMSKTPKKTQKSQNTSESPKKKSNSVPTTEENKINLESKGSDAVLMPKENSLKIASKQTSSGSNELTGTKRELNRPQVKEQPISKKKARSITTESRKQKIFRLLNLPSSDNQIQKKGSKPYSTYLIAYILIVAILLGGFAAIFETVAELKTNYSPFFILVEIICAIIFLLEFGFRWWTADVNPGLQDSKAKRLRYLMSTVGIVDLVSGVAFLLALVVPFESQIMIIVQLMRLVVFSKFIRYSSSFDIIWSVIKRKRQELSMTILLALILLFLSSFLIYIAENAAQPENFPNLFTSMYWAGVTLFTIGYGEIVPITTLGRMIAGLTSLIGISLFILPASVIGSGFVDEIKDRNPRFDVCPQCEKKISEDRILTDINVLKRKKFLQMQNTAQTQDSVQNIKQSKYIEIRNRLYFLLENKFPTKMFPKFIFSIFLILIGLNVFAIMIESNSDIYPTFERYLEPLYIISAFIFLVEYLLRLWICPSHPEGIYQHGFRGRLRYLITPLAITDLLVLFPYFLPLILPPILNALSIPIWDFQYFRILRLMVIFKIGHFTAIFEIIGDIVKDSFKDLLSALFIDMQVLLMTATLIFYAENGVQPVKFSSIPASLWWGIVTLTTTGYGDMVPMTSLGRFLTIAVAFIGIAIFTLPAGIIGAGFFSSMQQHRAHKICPYCGFILTKPKILDEKKTLDAK